MKRRHFLQLGGAAALLAGCGGSGGDRQDNPAAPGTPAEPAQRQHSVIAWNTAIMDAARAARSNAPLAARSLAAIHTAMYEAWAAYHPTAGADCACHAARRPAGEHTLANRREAFAYAAYATLLDQYPAQRGIAEAAMAALGYPQQAGTHGPSAVGTAVAAKVIERFHADGANQLGNLTPGGQPYADYTGYMPRNAPLIVSEPTPRSATAAPGHWQPLSYREADGTLRTPAYQLPFWGKVRPFALKSGGQFRPQVPHAFGSAAFVEQAEQIVQLQQALTEEHKTHIEFWAGGRTGTVAPSIWCEFAQHVSARDGHGDDQDILLFFALTNAAFDATIAAWDAKRAYDNARPISAIRYLLAGQSIVGYGPEGPAGGTRLIAGEAWMPHQLPGNATPPFADHVSGHSTVSAACADVLARYTGSDHFGHSITIEAGSLLIEPGLPSAPVTLSWPTFSAAAAQAGQSRLYSGIHFQRANTDGLQLGAQVGATVYAKAQRLWLGKA